MESSAPRRAMKPIAIIDFEASCLPEAGESYPVEVALATIDGRSRTWLIKPAPEWRYWDWSDEAESLHGISAAMLERDGLEPRRVLRELAEEAAGYRVCADCDLDAYWLDTLAAACRMPAPFPISYLGEVLRESGVTRPQVLAALDAAKLALPREHVARHDADRLAHAMRLLERQP